jgi:hypothetical protein
VRKIGLGLWSVGLNEIDSIGTDCWVFRVTSEGCFSTEHWISRCQGVTFLQKLKFWSYFGLGDPVNMVSKLMLKILFENIVPIPMTGLKRERSRYFSSLPPRAENG